MKLLSQLLLFFILLNSCKTSQDVSTLPKLDEEKDIVKEGIEGNWVGSAEFQPYPELITLTYDSILLVRMFYKGVELYQPTDFKFDAKTGLVNFTIQQSSLYEGSFEGRYDGERITGTFTDKDGKSACTFVRNSTVGFEQLGQMLGYFSFDSGRIIELEPFALDMNNTALMMLDYQSGKKRVVFPHESNRFLAGRKMLSPYPTEMELIFQFDEDQQLKSLEYLDFKEATPRMQGLRLQDLTEEESIHIKHDTISLFGTITYPNTKPPYPLVIFVPGAGEQFRGRMFDEYIKILPYFGIAVLRYDKRGSGESTGDRLSSTFTDFADDLLAVIEKAKSIKKIDAQKIGLLGFDQASYVMPIALSKNKDIQFMVMVSGAVVSLEEQEYHATQLRMKADGYGVEAIQEALHYQRKMFQYLRGEIDSVSLQNASEELKPKPWADYVTLFDNKFFMDWWRKTHTFTPAPYLNDIKVPILAIYGEKDLLVPIDKNKPLLEAYLQNIGRSESKIVVYPQANHLLMLGETRGDLQLSEIEGYAPNLFMEIVNWIGERVGLKD
jgi:pimeloyl-ACP methyl ester carboxylesterase